MPPAFQTPDRAWVWLDLVLVSDSVNNLCLMECIKENQGRTKLKRFASRLKVQRVRETLPLSVNVQNRTLLLSELLTEPRCAWILP